MLLTARLPRVPERVLLAALPVAALAFGYGLAMVGSLFGNLAPAVVIALPLAPLALVAVLADARIGVIVAFALIPVGTAKLGPIPAQLIIVVVIAFTGIVALRRLGAGLSPIAWAPPLWWLLALLMWAILGFPGAVDGALAIRQIAQLAGGILFSTLVVAACKDRRDVRVIAGGFIVVAFFIALIAVAGGQQLEAQFGGSLVSGRAQAPFTQPNELGSFCAPMALLAIAVAVAGSRRKVRVAAGITSVSLLAALALSLSRGAWIGLALGGVVLVVMLPEARKVLTWLAPALLVISVGMGAFAPSNPQVQVIGERLKSITGEKNPYDDRPAIWAEARREILAKPILGEGAGTFPVASVTATSQSRTTYAVHAHNLFLTWGAEAGVPAVLFIGALAFHSAVRASRARRLVVRPADAAVLAGASAALVAVLGQGMVDYTLRNSAVFVAVFGILGLQAASTRTLMGEE